ncbi:MAG: mannose-1-phosphate guanylyltransferase/mannose-6-phosphate isomerase [SAR324 cluster bacterium]|nr:mannose-1-phosphate guanylyltransferase/mannose-6-phosphate isomerase [SAR324 cluster bacterium]
MEASKQASPAEAQPAYGLVVAGGVGTRLWPLSRSETPKQFLSFTNGAQSLLQSTFARLSRSIAPERIKTVTNLSHSTMVLEQLRSLAPDYPRQNVLGEPFGKNSAPAILWGALHIHCEAPDAVLAVLWSDAHITKEDLFDANLKLAVETARGGDLVAIGVTPTRPETGLGYIQFGEPVKDGVFAVKQFIEKPDLPTAEKFLAEGGYAWNAGIFVFNVRTLLDEFAAHAPGLNDIFLAHGGKDARHDWSDPELIESIYEQVTADSIDCLLLEKTRKLQVIPCDLDWSDLGAWDVVYQGAPKDDSGNAISGNVVTASTKNSLIRGGRRLITTVGVENLVVVDTDDALLICDMAKVQQVKQLVETLKAHGKPEAEQSATTVRPWGSFTVIYEGEGFKLKIIEVQPGQRLSLQTHKKRAEHWVVIEGEAQVVLAGEELTLGPGDACHIPRETVHRIGKAGVGVLRFVEVQYGDYLGEDDIERIEDIYGRS